jgi:acetolactate synthase small subunit
MELSLAQKFETERFNRIIDETQDVEQLRKIAKELLQVWQVQKAATLSIMKDNLTAPSQFQFPGE